MSDPTQDASLTGSAAVPEDVDEGIENAAIADDSYEDLGNLAAPGANDEDQADDEPEGEDA